MPKLKTRKTVVKKVKIKKNIIKRRKAHAAHLMSKRRTVARRRSKTMRIEAILLSPFKKFIGKLIAK